MAITIAMTMINDEYYRDGKTDEFSAKRRRQYLPVAPGEEEAAKLLVVK
eukprot:CAMPEP_0203655790 /NCGR_PEP_ID=MMETSP0088-20131115/39461_1 /ASSEMBLY_ACC=CAM_ASM_001087 /TAXON_ID=426623 /ORGANISM="Chaetoceros affinis, Strain CCMP159" /LENGTH=48 /DNA_ID= /DNA_START= /DNA_END= /DNA_ORIENTATION=